MLPTKDYSGEIIHISKEVDLAELIRNKPSGFKATVVKNRAAIEIVDFGTSPFTSESTNNGKAHIPSHFIVYTRSDKEIWIGETIVDEVSSDAYYRFTLKRDLSIQSTWQPNPTAAYKDVISKAGLQARNGSNGRLILGVHYPNIQSLICDKHKLKIFESSGDKKRTNPMKRVKRSSNKRVKTSSTLTSRPSSASFISTNSSESDSSLSSLTNETLDDWLTIDENEERNDLLAILEPFEADNVDFQSSQDFPPLQS